MNQEERIIAMADIMVKARRANEDMGELIASALHKAAERLGGADKLVIGRPGSWEADIIVRMADAGGDTNNVHTVALLCDLFVEMGEAKEDGGDILSQAMGEAINTIGGVVEFAADSQWYLDLWNIGCQYSRYNYPS